MGVNGEADQYEINTNDVSFNWLHIPPKMFVDLISQYKSHKLTHN